MLLLRKEKFGGIVFNSNNGHQVSLDKDAFNLLKKIVAGGEPEEDNKNFISNLFNELAVKEKNTFLNIDLNTNGQKEYPFDVLNSPTLVDLQITNKCNLNCPHCYAESGSHGDHIPLKDAIIAIENCKRSGAFEIALGGGEPTLHPYFIDILKEIRKRNMVPNLASNGKYLSEENIEAIKKYCGAVALSVEFIGEKFEERRGFPFKDFLKSVDKLKNNNIKLVFQVTISKSNLDDLKNTTSFLSKLSPYGIVYLTYKPVGRGENFDSTLLSENKKETAKIIKDCFLLLQDETKVGYDCCLANILIGQGLSDDNLINGCSAVRSSLAVNRNMDVVPCSFSPMVLGNLKKDSLQKIWNNELSHKFRNKFLDKTKNNSSCSACNYKYNCLGGCPEFDLIECNHK